MTIRPTSLTTFRLLSVLIAACCVLGQGGAHGQSTPGGDSTSTGLPYPMQDSQNPLNRTRNPLNLNRPTTQVVQYDPISGRYILREKIGDVFIGEGTPLSYEEYLRWEREKNKKAYWKDIH